MCAHRALASQRALRTTGGARGEPCAAGCASSLLALRAPPLLAGVANAQTSVCESESECWVTLNGAAGENEYVYRYTTDEDCGVDVVALFPHGSTSFLYVAGTSCVCVCVCVHPARV